MIVIGIWVIRLGIRSAKWRTLMTSPSTYPDQRRRTRDRIRIRVPRLSFSSDLTLWVEVNSVQLQRSIVHSLYLHKNRWYKIKFYFCYKQTHIIFLHACFVARGKWKEKLEGAAVFGEQQQLPSSSTSTSSSSPSESFKPLSQWSIFPHKNFFCTLATDSLNRFLLNFNGIDTICSNFNYFQAV